MTQKEEERLMAQMRSNNIMDRKELGVLKSRAVKAIKIDNMIELIAALEMIKDFFQNRKKLMKEGLLKISSPKNQKIIETYLKKDEEELKIILHQFDVS